MAQEYTTGGYTFTIPQFADVVNGDGAFKSLCDDVATALGSLSTAVTDATYLPVISKTASWTPALGEANKMVLANHATVAMTCTLPSDASVDFPIGTQIPVTRYGAAAVAYAAGAGATVKYTPGLSLRATNSVGSALKTEANTWLVSGDIA